MVLPHDEFPFDNPYLNWPGNQQENIIQELHALAWKQLTDFVGYRKIVAFFRKITTQVENHEQLLQEELVAGRNPGNWF